MNKISARQLYFFLACVAPVGKLVILPSRLAFYSRNDLLIPAAVNFLIQAAVIFCVLLLAKRNVNLYELLSNTFGKVIGKIVILIFSAFLLYAALLPLLEQKVFVQGTFYDTIPSLVAFAPFFLVSAYLCAKPLYSYGRTWDILGPIAIAGFAGVLVMSIGEADFGSLLPVGASGVKGIFGGTAYSFSWFFDSALLLMMLGKIKYEKNMAWKGALYYLLGGFLALLFLATFYGIYQETSINQLFAFTKTSKYFSAITVLGRVDYIFIYLLAFVMIFYCSLPLQAAIEGVVQGFGQHKYLPSLLSVGINGIMLLLLYIFNYRFGEVLHIVSELAFWVFPIFTVVLPLLCLLLRRTKYESA